MIEGFFATTAGGAAAPPLLLDEFPNASAAYSLRRLSTAYTNDLIMVRRSSDNTSLKIGYDANGNLDTVALLNFAGGEDAFVTTWYDQSGNNKHLSMPTENRQPSICIAGVVNLLIKCLSAFFPSKL